MLLGLDRGRDLGLRVRKWRVNVEEAMTEEDKVKKTPVVRG